MAPYNRNANNTVRNEQALKVPCPYCKARAGERCWTLRHRKNSESEYYDAPQEPHRARIKESWRKQYREKVRTGVPATSDGPTRYS